MPIGMFADSNPDNATGRDIAIAAGLTVAPLLIAAAPELASILAPRLAPGLIGAGGSGFGSWVSGNCTEQILIDSSIGFFGGAAVGPLLASRLSGLSMYTPHSSFLLASTTSASTAFIGDLTSQIVTTGNVNASRSFNATVFGGASGMAAGFSLMHRGGNALNFAETLGGEAFSSFLAIPSNLQNRADNSCNNPCR